MKYSLNNKKYNKKLKKSVKHPKKIYGGMPMINGYVIEPGTNLARANLNGINLTGLNLTNCNLYYANLQGAILNSATLANVNLEGAKLMNAQLYDTNLSNSHIIWANLYSANLANSICFNCDFNASSLQNTDLINANLTNSTFNSSNLINANLSNADLTNTQMVSAVLRNTDLTNTTFVNANLYYAYFSNSVFRNADIRNANLKNSDLMYTNFENSILDNCDVIGAHFHNNNFNNASLDNINLEESYGNFNGVYNISHNPSSLPLGCVIRNHENGLASIFDCTGFYHHNLEEIDIYLTASIEDMSNSLDIMVRFLDDLEKMKHILHVLSEYAYILNRDNLDVDPLGMYIQASEQITNLRTQYNVICEIANSQLDESNAILNAIHDENFRTNRIRNELYDRANRFPNDLLETKDNLNNGILNIDQHISQIHIVLYRFQDMISLHNQEDIHPINLRRPIVGSNLYSNIVVDATDIITENNQTDNIQLRDENSIIYYCDVICQVFNNIRLELFYIYQDEIENDIEMDEVDEVDAQHVHNEFTKQKIFIPGIMEFFMRNIPDGEKDLTFSGNMVEFIREHMYSYIEGAVFPEEEAGMQLYNADNIRQKMTHIFERLSLQSSYNFNMVIINDITIKNIIIAILKYIRHREKIFQSLYVYLWSDDTFNAYQPGSDAASSVSCIPGMIERIILNVKSASQVMLTLEGEHPLDSEYIRLVNIMFVPNNIMAIKSVLDSLCSKKTLSLDRVGRLSLLKSAMLLEVKRQLIEVYNIPELNVESHLAYIDISDKIDTYLSLPDSTGSRLDNVIADDDLLKMLLCSEYPELDDE